MFDFWKRSSNRSADPLRSPAAARAWLQCLPQEDDAARHRRILAVVKEFGHDATAIDDKRIAAIDCMHAAALREMRRLVTQYIAGVERAPVLADALWTTMHERNLEFVGAYRGALASACSADAGPARTLPVAWLLARVMRCLGIDAALLTLRFERVPAARWVELHRCYRLAVACGVARVSPSHDGGLPDAPGLCVEQEYLAVLFAQRINHGNLAPADFDFLGERVRQGCRDLALERTPGAATNWCVDVDGRDGLLPPTGRAGATLRFVDAAPLVAHLRRELAELALHRGTASARQHHERVAALDLACRTLLGSRATDQRRATRAPIVTVAQVRLGFASIRSTLARAGDGSAFAAGAVRTSAAMTATLAELDALAHSASRPSTWAPAWTIVDRSVAGLRVRGSVTARGLAIGALIAVQAGSDDPWMLCTVRRVTRVTDDVLEAGLSVIASEVTAATLHAPCAARDDMHVIVDGVDLSAMGAQLHGLFVPAPGAARHDWQRGTLVMPACDHAAGRRFIVAVGDRIGAAILKAPLERHGDWVRVAFEMVAPVSAIAA